MNQKIADVLYQMATTSTQALALLLGTVTRIEGKVDSLQSTLALLAFESSKDK
jgi:hypothetical protein